MKKIILIAQFSTIILILIASACKKKSNSTPIVVTPLPPPVTVVKIDPLTPLTSQPLVLGADGKPLTTVTTSMSPNGYQLDFSDEFNASSLNGTKWNISESTTSRSPRPSLGINAWFFKKEMIAMSGTDLIIKASKFNASTMYCGAVTSDVKYEQRYGFFETRIDNADILKAVHTAFWLQGQNQGNVNGSGNDGCEIDVFESAFTSGKQTQSTLHWDGYGASTQAWTKHWANAGNYGADIHDGYHIFGLEWDETGLAFYYDGIKMFTYSGVGTPLVKEYLLLSVGASFGDGDFANQPLGDLTTSKVDWIRVYTKK